MADAVVAVVQASPVFLDREATVDKACALVKEAAAAGASLVLFPEAFLPGYPDWVWRVPAWSDSAYLKRLLDQSVTIPSPAVDRLKEASRESGAYIAIGVNELGGGTLYNTLLYVAPDGELLAHRKVMPTGGERSVWGYGDGSTLGVLQTPFGIVGGLLCWENYMPLARAAVYAQGVEIYVAPTWDNSDVWVASMRHIAKEGRCYVLACAPVLRATDVPEELRGDAYGDADDWMSRGGAVIVGPDGALLAGPVWEEETILYAEVSRDRIALERREFDVVGHYSRPDVFQLNVNTAALRPVTFT